MTCSFCGATDLEVQWLIAGPDVYICDECVAECAAIIAGQQTTLFERDCLARTTKRGGP